MTRTGKPLTGRKVLAIAIAAFGTIIGVNLLLAWKAISTFPGLEVENSYVASQQFDARRNAQEALDWTLDAAHADGMLTLSFTDARGKPVAVKELSVLVGRTTEARDDMVPAMRGYNGRYTAPVTLAPGRWLIRVSATSEDGTLFEQRRDLFVRK